MNLTHAGGVVFRQSKDRVFYLVISSSDASHLVLPKGHIEPGEAPENTALRELQEETGVIGEIVAELGTQQFKMKDTVLLVQYYLIEERDSMAAEEDRSLRWVDEQSALQLLSFEDAREVLRKGVEVLEQL